MSEKKQASLIVQMLRQVKYCKEIEENTSISALKLKLDQVKKLYEDFEANQNDIDEVCKAEDIDEQNGQRAKFEDQYFYCFVRLQDMINKINVNIANLNVGANGNNGHRQQEVKLPRIELKTFSGKYEDWASFRDLFDTQQRTFI